MQILKTPTSVVIKDRNLNYVLALAFPAILILGIEIVLLLSGVMQLKALYADVTTMVATVAAILWFFSVVLSYRSYSIYFIKGAPSRAEARSVLGRKSTTIFEVSNLTEGRYCYSAGIPNGIGKRFWFELNTKDKGWVKIWRTIRFFKESTQLELEIEPISGILGIPITKCASIGETGTILQKKIF